MLAAMGKINAAWHKAHRMPANPTLDQRIAWHIDHAKHCGCRPIAGKIREEMLKRGLKIPVFRGPER
jgi:hypothetical protein